MTATLHDLHLHRLTPREAAQLVAIRNACADALTERFGVGPWSSHGHLVSTRQLTREKHAFVARLDGRSVATMTLSEQRPGVHRADWFAAPTARACYLTGLYVLPDLQRLGVGTWMMTQADRIAREWGCVALRFDAYAGPGGASRFYQRLGYESRGRREVCGIALEVFERRFR